MELYYKIINWISINYLWSISLVVQIFIAYHILHLSRRLSNRARLEHKNNIKSEAEKLLSEIWREKLSGTVILVNIRRYFNDYPNNNEKRFSGYSHLKASIKSTRFDGIEVFAEMPRTVYQRSDSKLSFEGIEEEKMYNVNPVGVIPYEWIEYIDLDGDEYECRPIIYCYFKGRTNWHFWKRFLFFGYPYKKMLFYTKRDLYDEKNDPPDTQWSLVREKIHSK